MSEDARKIKDSIGKVDPQLLGKMFREYFTRQDNIPVGLAKVLVEEKTATSEVLKVFDGGIF